VTAEISMSVELPHHFKGTHMSRFIEVLNDHRGEMTLRTIPGVLRDLKERLDAERAHIEVFFSYFLERVAPVSKSKALMDFHCGFVGESNGDKDDFLIRVTVPVTTLCPCSKEISEYGAHNHRGHVTLEVRTVEGESGAPTIVWFEELIEIVDESASAPLYPLLKRPDERFVTMQAYDNPRFVEDMVRNVAMRLKEDDRISWFRVEAVDQESIHNHDAFARVTWSRNGQKGVDS
jgi:GTP cyclohydrolase I